MEHPPIYGPEFYFEGYAVGLFIGGSPHTSGRHQYEPYRGPGHYELQTSLSGNGKPRCFYDTDSVRVAFTVCNCPEYGILELQEFEESPLNPA